MAYHPEVSDSTMPQCLCRFELLPSSWRPSPSTMDGGSVGRVVVISQKLELRLFRTQALPRRARYTCLENVVN